MHRRLRSDSEWPRRFLVIGVVVALVETVGVAAVGQVLQFAEQTRHRRAAGDGVVDGLAIDPAGAGDVVETRSNGILVRPSIFNESYHFDQAISARWRDS